MQIIIPKPEVLERRKLEIKKDGYQKLHVLSDFDRTLTYGTVDGKKTPSIISMLRDGNHLAKGYAEKANKLFEKYHSIEISTRRL
jgi:5'-nucleotidase